MINFIRNYPYLLYYACILLLFPTFLIHLGLMPVLADEPTRALVTLEMMISGNYIVPTIQGEYYYNKPPLYNWILASFVKLTGSFSELVIRLPAIIPLFLFGLTIFTWVKKHASFKIAFFSAIFTISCGRILIYDSMLGHIDMLYALITYCGFIIIHEFYEKRDYGWLFLISYSIAAIGFLTKGFPSLLFQGLTLIAVFGMDKNLRKLFSWQHLIGILGFMLLVGTYFAAYHQHNPLQDYFHTMWLESTSRTIVEKAWYESFIHLFLFPFESLYHVLPWSLLIIYCFRRNFLQTIRGNNFLKFNLLVLLVNIPVYWLAPDTLPRYIFMLYPLVFTLISFFFVSYELEDKRRSFWLHKLFLVFIVFLCLASLIPIALPGITPVQNVFIKSMLVFGGILFLLYLFIKMQEQRVLIIVLVLLVARIGFNWFVLPHRHENSIQSKHKAYALSISEISNESKLKIFEDTYLNHDISFYISREKMQHLERTRGTHTCDDMYITNKCYDEVCDGAVQYRFETRHKLAELFLVTLNKNCYFNEKGEYFDHCAE